MTTTTIELSWTILVVAWGLGASPLARADVVEDFTNKTKLQSGEYKPTKPGSDDNCPEGPFTIEPDTQGGVLLRLGPEILADAVSEKPIRPTRERACVTSHRPATLSEGHVDALKVKKCSMKGFENVEYHSVFTVTPEGFIHVLSYASGHRRECHFKRQ